MNNLTDMDWGWWPLIKMRPPKDQFIDNALLLKITPFFGTQAALLFYLLVFIFNKEILSIKSFVIALLLCWI